MLVGLDVEFAALIAQMLANGHHAIGIRRSAAGRRGRRPSPILAPAANALKSAPRRLPRLMPISRYRAQRCRVHGRERRRMARRFAGAAVFGGVGDAAHATRVRFHVADIAAGSRSDTSRSGRLPVYFFCRHS